MTLLENAANNTLTGIVKKVAATERVNPRALLKNIREGRVVIPANRLRKLQRPAGIGLGLRTKVNANLGTSSDECSLKKELEKLRAACVAGADTVMDLSVGGNLKKVRSEIIKRSPVPVGTVPLYEISVRAVRKNRHAADFNPGEMLEVISAQAAEGVDFFTIHAGVTRKAVGLLKRRRRIMDVVSRGGAVVCAWMRRRKQENPFYEHFDQILDICRAYDVTLSLGDGLRPGSIFDATDAAQIEELRTLGALALRCRKKGVQAIIEGPGHVPINQIRENVLLEKRLCRGAPFYILGPLVTDIAAGYDHINAAIGGALAASYGADFLCYVTASEHLRQPPAEDVKEGVVASRIAAHAADIAKGLKPARDWDRQMSLARRKRDWQKQIELSVNPEKAARYRASSLPRQKDVCTMCGEFCSSKMMDEVMRA